LNHDICKYFLSCLVHKDNKDILAKPTQQPPGHSRIEARGRKEKALEVERAVAKADHPVEKYGDMDHQLKNIRVEGMQSQVLKNRADVIKTNVDAIMTQIELMQQMESVYVWKMGQSKYDDMIFSLINQLPSMKSSIDFSETATSSANPELPDGGVSTLKFSFYIGVSFLVVVTVTEVTVTVMRDRDSDGVMAMVTVTVRATAVATAKC